MLSPSIDDNLSKNHISCINLYRFYLQIQPVGHVPASFRSMLN